MSEEEEFDSERYDSDVDDDEKGFENDLSSRGQLRGKCVWRGALILSSTESSLQHLLTFEAGKRAYHNLLERKRRDNIKDSFCQLRDVIPYFRKKKKVRASRVQILKKSCEFIRRQPDLQKLKEENARLEEENKLLEKSLADLDKAIENNDTETIARLQSMNLPLKRRHIMIESDDTDSDDDDDDTSDEDSGSSPPEPSPVAAGSSSRRKVKRS